MNSKTLKLLLVGVIFVFAAGCRDESSVTANNNSTVNIVESVKATPTPSKRLELPIIDKEKGIKVDVTLDELPKNPEVEAKPIIKIEEKPKATPFPTPAPVILPEVAPRPIIIQEVVVAAAVPKQSSQNIQAKIINVAQKYVGETESHGNNRSPFIDKINKFAGDIPLGSPYCASFVSWVLYEAGAINPPKSAWSPTILAKNNILFGNIKAADCFGLYFSNLKRIGHTGFIKNPNYNSSSISTIEANTSFTSVEGSSEDREGKSGVVSKLRSKKLMANPRNKFSRYW